MIKITYHKALEALEAAVADRGEGFVYEKPENSEACKYVHIAESGELTPGCGVGYALHRLGVPLEDLAEHELQAAEDIIVSLSAQVSSTLNAAVLFREFQTRQDRGLPWGEALKRAVQYANSNQ